MVSIFPYVSKFVSTLIRLIIGSSGRCIKGKGRKEREMENEKKGVIGLKSKVGEGSKWGQEGRKEIADVVITVRVGIRRVK